MIRIWGLGSGFWVLTRRRRRVVCTTQHPAPKTQNQRGYTLIELAVVMTILAVLVSGGLSMFQRRDEATKNRETLARMITLDHALQDYYSLYGHLPCPAPGEATRDIPYQIGEEYFYTGEAVPYDPKTHKCATLKTGEGGDTPHGTVPTRTLHLSDTMMLDGWRRKIGYQLSPGMGSAEDFVDDTQYPGMLSVVDMNDNELTGLEGEGNYGAAYVMISYGQNGGYAWQRNGDQRGAPLIPAPLEDENGNDDTPEKYRQGERARDFDDMVIFRSKSDVAPRRRLVSPIMIPDAICARAGKMVESDLAPYSNETSFPENAAVFQKAAFALFRLCQKGAAPLEEKCGRNLVYKEVADGVEDCVCLDDDKTLVTIPGVQPFGACLER